MNQESRFPGRYWDRHTPNTNAECYKQYAWCNLTNTGEDKYVRSYSRKHVNSISLQVRTNSNYSRVMFVM